MFPGQGSQSIGMGLDLFKKFDYVKELFNFADDCLKKKISKIILEGPEDQLKLTQNTQPAIMIVSYSFLKSYKKNSALIVNILKILLVIPWENILR